ncbi:MAG: hypothetical protein ACI9GH_000344 [Candidatus Paceibacteria bacterium]|jgi:hypothetical protein
MEYATKDFLNKLLIEKGVEGVPEDVRNQMVEDLESRLEKMIDATILNNIPEGDLEEFEKKLDSSDENEMQSFIKEKIPNLDEVLAGVFLKFRKIYLENSI